MTNEQVRLVTNYVKEGVETVLAGGAPVMAFVGSLAIGIFLHKWPRFKNAWIPVIEILFAVPVMLVLGVALIPQDIGQTAFQRHFAAGILGLIIGVASWMFRIVVLKKILNHRIFNGHAFDTDPPIVPDPPVSHPMSRRQSLTSKPQPPTKPKT